MSAADLGGLPQPLDVAQQPAGAPLGRGLQREEVGRGRKRFHLRLGELRLVVPPTQHLVGVARVAAQPAQRAEARSELAAYVPSPWHQAPMIL